MNRIASLAAICVLLLAVRHVFAGAETAKSADAFVDSVGVNVHLSYLDTPYAEFSRVKESLQTLGIRHIRDGLIDAQSSSYYDELNELGRLGIQCTLVTSPRETAALLTAYPSRVSEGFEAFEAPNEYDLSGDPNWSSTLNTFLFTLHQAVKSDSLTSRFPIIGPSLTQTGSFPQLAASADLFDYANLHNYFGGRNPGTSGWGSNGYGSLGWNLALVRSAWPDKPLITTETGYLNDAEQQQSVPEAVAAKYLPRLLLEQWTHGIARTYLYQLLDLGSERFSDNSFGLMHSDFSAKPGYSAVSSLLKLLSDAGPPFQPGSLDFSLSGDLSNVHHVLLQKRDGTFYLAIWLEAPGYDVNAKVVMPIANQKVVLETRQKLTIRILELDDNGFMETLVRTAGQSQAVTVGDRVTVVEMSR
jgi:hypothetical protein